MKVETYTFQNKWDKPFNTSLDSKQTLILIFSSIDTSALEKELLPSQHVLDFYSTSIHEADNA